MNNLLRQRIQERQQELIDLAAALIRVPSENPHPELVQHSATVGRLIADYLQAKGLAVQTYRRETELTNLVAEAPLAGAPGPRLLFCGHTDVVPVGDRSRWSFDPFSGEVRDGILLGRGASDMKAGLAAQLFVAGLLQELAQEMGLPGSLGVVIVADEETGGHETSWLLEEAQVKGDGCLIAEPSDPQHPTIGQKGSCWMKLTVPGEPGHGSLQPLSGVSAIRRAARAIEALAGLWELQSTPPAELDELMRRTRQYMKERMGDERFVEVMRRVSYNPGVIQGGSKVNVVADTCTVEIDTRVPYGLQPEVVLAEAQSLVAEVAPGAVIEPFGYWGSPNWTLETHPMILALEESIRTVLGADESVYSVLQWASSDARHFRAHGIDVAQYGPAILSTIHGYDERVPVADVVRAAEVYAEMALNFLNSR